MGSSVGSLYGNQEQGNGDAAVHGLETTDKPKDQETEESLQNPMPPDSEVPEPTIGDLPVKLVKQKKRTGKAGRREKNVKDALDEMEIAAESEPRDEFFLVGVCTKSRSIRGGAAKDVVKGPAKEENSTLKPSKKLMKPKAKAKKNRTVKLSPNKFYLLSKPPIKDQENSSISSVDQNGDDEYSSMIFTAEEVECVAKAPEFRDFLEQQLLNENSGEFSFKPFSIATGCLSASNSTTKRRPNAGSENQNHAEITGIRNISKSRSISRKQKKILKARRRNPQSIVWGTSQSPVGGSAFSNLRCNMKKTQMNKLDLEINCPKFHGLPASLWERIMMCLSFQELKNFRLVSPDINNLVEQSLPWAMNACFLMDGESESWKEANISVCPPELICEDNTLGWPDVRFKNISHPFSVETFWYSQNVRGSIKFLEIKDCRLSWHDLHSILSGLKNIEEFAYILSDHFIRYNDMYMVLMKDFSNFDVQKVLQQNPCRKAEKGELTSTIKKITLNALNLEFTNAVLSVLEEIVRNGLEELRIFFSYDDFLNVPFYPDPKLFGLEKELRGKILINNNLETLQVIQISFDQITSNLCPNPLIIDILYCPTLPVIYSNLTPRLNLKELILELPISAPIYLIGDKCTNCNLKFDHNVYEESLSNLAKFCTLQTKLRRLKVSWIDLNRNIDIPLKIVNSMQNQAWKNTDSCDVELGAKLRCTDNNMNLPDWEKFKNALVDISITYSVEPCGTVLFYNQLISETMPVMKKVKHFDLRSSAKDLRNFNVPIIAAKFPSLTCLILGDIRIRAEGLTNAIVLDDTDFQTILFHLQNLVELRIKCNMSLLSDYGLTGIPLKRCQRMMSRNSFKRELGDVTGLPLSSLKKLQVLELHGVGKRVTNVSAYLAFKNLPELQGLYISSPNFSKLAKKLLNQKFGLQNGFKIIIK